MIDWFLTRPVDTFQDLSNTQVASSLGKTRVLADRHTFNEGGFEVRGPYDLALAFNRLPALSAAHDSLDRVRGVWGGAGGGDGVGDVVHGGDADVVGHAVASGGHGAQWWCALCGRRWCAEGRGGCLGRGQD